MDRYVLNKLNNNTRRDEMNGLDLIVTHYIKQLENKDISHDERQRLEELLEQYFTFIMDR